MNASSSGKSPSSPLLSVDGLTLEVRRNGVPVPIVEDVSFSVNRREVVAIVGESGCGKSTTALSLMRILPPAIRIARGRIELEGRDLLRLAEPEMRAIRGDSVAMIFQDPMTSLNPVLTIGEQMVEGIRSHRDISRRDAAEIAVDMLTRVRIPEPRKRLMEYPHTLSGGMRQRIMIAMALSTQPKLLIADEPTTALDVTIQLQILMLLKDLQHEFETGIVLITHSIGVVAEVADRIVVLYAGRVVEQGRTREVLGNPRHPYTRGLIASTPRFVRADPGERTRLIEIGGVVPALGEKPPGCAFAPRCPQAAAACRAQVPADVRLSETHQVACARVHELEAVA
ncbi:MAG: ABC transporter ATP-binding protein [Burkholderiaceae bacterium]